jgi:hypothetical protein
MLLDEADEEEEPEPENDFIQPAEGVDAEDVPLGVESEESATEDLTDGPSEIIDEDEPRENDEF